MKRNDLTGQRFGKLLVKKYSCSKDGNSCWECVCDCGKEKIIASHHLRYGDIRSCGCLKKGCFKKPNGSKSPLWKGYEEISGNYFGKLKKNAKERKIKFLVSIEEIWDLFLNQNRKCALSGKEIFFNPTFQRIKENFFPRKSTLSILI